MSAIEHGGGESHRCDASSSTLSQVGIIAINRPQREKKRIKNKSKMKSQFPSLLEYSKGKSHSRGPSPAHFFKRNLRLLNDLDISMTLSIPLTFLKIGNRPMMIARANGWSIKTYKIVGTSPAFIGRGIPIVLYIFHRPIDIS